jgi:hypothetical protein
LDFPIFLSFVNPEVETLGTEEHLGKWNFRNKKEGQTKAGRSSRPSKKLSLNKPN